MKGIKKYLFIMAALAAVFGFVACSDEDDDPSAVAVYKSSVYTATFYDDNSWSTVGKVASQEMTVAAGTYTGAPGKHGDSPITTTKYLGADGSLADVPNASA